MLRMSRPLYDEKVKVGSKPSVYTLGGFFIWRLQDAVKDVLCDLKNTVLFSLAVADLSNLTLLTSTTLNIP